MKGTQIGNKSLHKMRGNSKFLKEALHGVGILERILCHTKVASQRGVNIMRSLHA